MIDPSSTEAGMAVVSNPERQAHVVGPDANLYSTVSLLLRDRLRANVVGPI